MRSKHSVPTSQYHKHLLTAPSCMHLTEPPALLKTLPTKVVDVRATGNPLAILVEPLNSKRQSLIEKPEDIVTSDEAEGKRIKRQMQLAEMTMTPNVMKLVLLEWHSALSHAKWPTADHYHLRNPELIAITGVSIDGMTNAFANV